MQGMLESLAKMFGKDVNAYDIVVQAAKTGEDADAQLVLDTLNKAMEETGVIQESVAKSQVGNLVLRLSFFMTDIGKPVEVDLEEFPEFEAVVDTYDRFNELMGIAGEGTGSCDSSLKEE